MMPHASCFRLKCFAILLELQFMLMFSYVACVLSCYHEVSVFFFCFLSLFDNLPHIFVLKKIISELCILFLSQILDAVSSLVFSCIVQFHHHFNSCLVSRVLFVVWFITLTSSFILHFLIIIYVMNIPLQLQF
jgi:hypothetical protein